MTASSSNTGLIPNPTVTYTSPNATGSIGFTPVANANGTATVTVTVNDGQASNNTVVQTFLVTVNAVNDQPTLNALSPLTINEDAGLQTVNLAGITAGGGETQTLTVTASSSNTGLIPNPTVTYTSPNATGSIGFTPVANANGTATVTVTVNDGQASNNTVVQTFLVTVNAVNDQPTLNALSPLTINEDPGLQTVALGGIAAGGGETQTLTVTASSSNTGLIPTPTVTYTSPNATGSIGFTPVANASGTATVTVTVNDGQASNNTVVQTFLVTVNAVNDQPTLNALSPLTISEDAGLQTVALSGISAGGGETQTLTVTASSSNTGLIPNPTVTYTSPNATGSIGFTPVANTNGTATVTVTVNDGQASNNTVVQTFLVTVNPINDAPTLNAIANVTIGQDAPAQTVNLAGISAGLGESQTLTVTARSSNTGLIPDPTVTYTSPNATGSITFTPVASAFGSATITVTVNDGQAANNTAVRTFIVTVNDVPTDIHLSSNLVIDGAPTGTTVGTLSTTDRNVGDTFTYSIVGGDTAVFRIQGDLLKTDQVFDFAVKSIRVRSTDSGNSWTEKDFTIVPASYVLWTRSDTGLAALWKVDPGTGAVVRGIYVNGGQGIGAPWQATSYAHLSATSGKASLDAQRYRAGRTVDDQPRHRRGRQRGVRQWRGRDRSALAGRQLHAGQRQRGLCALDAQRYRSLPPCGRSIPSPARSPAGCT